MRERASIIKEAIKAGVYSLNDIIKTYNTGSSQEAEDSHKYDGGTDNLSGNKNCAPPTYSIESTFRNSLNNKKGSEDNYHLEMGPYVAARPRPDLNLLDSGYARYFDVAVKDTQHFTPHDYSKKWSTNSPFQLAKLAALDLIGSDFNLFDRGVYKAYSPLKNRAAVGLMSNPTLNTNFLRNSAFSDGGYLGTFTQESTEKSNSSEQVFNENLDNISTFSVGNSETVGGNKKSNTKKQKKSKNNLTLAPNNWKDQWRIFRDSFEQFIPVAIEDKYAKERGNPGIYLVGSGLRYIYNEDGTLNHKVKKGETITREENEKQQLYAERRLRAELIKDLKLTNLDKYHPELLFQIFDIAYNAGVGSIKNSVNYKKELQEYEKNRGWEDPKYDLNKIFIHGDWSDSNTKSLGIRSRMRRFPRYINTDDYNIVYDMNKTDSLIAVYDENLIKEGIKQ